MRKKIILLLFLILITTAFGCKKGKTLKVYEDTEEFEMNHDEVTMTAVVTNLELEDDSIEFMDCYSGERISIGYHGGVSILNAHGNEMGISGLLCGDVVDVVYYRDTNRLVSIAIDSDVVVMDNANKLSIDKKNQKASCYGKSYTLYEYAVAFDDNKAIDIMEVNTEDKVKIYIYNNKLISVIVEEGHGYVSLYNHETYIDGMVEIGRDVIVPVTHEMLIPVRAGNYTLRITKNGYSSEKNITVIKGDETRVDIGTIAVPKGTVTFNVTPADANVYIEGTLDADHVYTNIYGSYSLRIEAEGYNTFRGSFKISQSVKSYDIELKKKSDSTEEDTTEDTEDSSDDASDDKSTSDTDTEDGTGSSTSEHTSENTITVKTPKDVGVYFDGEYMGKAPVTFPKKIGTHTITLYMQGYLIKSYTIQANDDGKDDEYSFAALTSVLDTFE